MFTLISFAVNCFYPNFLHSRDSFAFIVRFGD